MTDVVWQAVDVVEQDDSTSLDRVSPCDVMLCQHVDEVPDSLSAPVPFRRQLLDVPFNAAGVVHEFCILLFGKQVVESLCLGQLLVFAVVFFVLEDVMQE